jgi:actin-related protein 5
MPQFVDTAVNSGRNSPKPAPTKIWNLNEPPFEGFKPIDGDGYKKGSSGSAIVVDFGESLLFTASNCCCDN